MSFLNGTEIPNIPPNPLQDLASIGLQKVRGLINKQRSYSAPTDEDLKRKQAPLIRKINGTSGSATKSEIPDEFDTRVDVTSQTFTENTDFLEQHEFGTSSTTSNTIETGKTYTSPSDRIDRDLSLIDTSTGKSVKFPFVPGELRYNPESHFKAIASMGRNNPLYHYTGSEDTLEFDIDWFSEKDHRYDVLQNCKWVESLSKNDAYDNPPPAVILHWNKDMFSDSLWLVVAAPYNMSQFQAHRNMLPQQAIQKVTLKRTTATNLSRKQIQSITV